MKTLFASLMLMTGLATSPAAQSLADEFFAQCTGPSLERQAETFYGLQSCQQTQSCPPYIFERYRREVTMECVHTALHICRTGQEVNDCTDRVAEALTRLEAALREDITQERIDAAIAKPGLAARGLATLLEQDKQETSCENSPMEKLLIASGLSAEVACAVFDAMVSYNLAEFLAVRLARIEAAE